MKKMKVKRSSVAHLVGLLVRGWDNVALSPRETVREPLQDVGVSLQGRLVMAWKHHNTIQHV